MGGCQQVKKNCITLVQWTHCRVGKSCGTNFEDLNFEDLISTFLNVYVHPQILAH